LVLAGGITPAARPALLLNHLFFNEKTMTCGSAVLTTGAMPIRRARLSSASAFYLLASLSVSFLAGSSAPTPLYPLYQAQWGFAPVTVTVVFGIYALAVLSALLVVGRLSDNVGRRPVLLVATLVQAVTMLVFATATGVADLLVARVIQGLSTGAAVAAVGAGLIDLDRARGTMANSIAPMMGTAFGGLAAGLMVHYLPAPAHLVYLVLCAIFLLQAVGVMLMPESVVLRPGALASLKPQFRVPAAVRESMLLAVPALVAAWALVGFYASLGPALLHRIFGFDSSLSGGLALFVLAGSGGVAVLLLQRHEARTMMTLGAAGLVAGVGIALAALSIGYAAAFFAGTALAGMGFGAGFQGAVRTVVPFVAPHERAGVLSVTFVVSYLAMGAPAVLAGYLISQGGSIVATAQEFGSVVMVLATAAMMGTIAQRAS
jgi:predicted MFS family arabinose efflux permease